MLVDWEKIEEECIKEYKAGSECLEYYNKEDELDCLSKRLDQVVENIYILSEWDVQKIIKFAQFLIMHSAKQDYDKMIEDIIEILNQMVYVCKEHAIEEKCKNMTVAFTLFSKKLEENKKST